MLGRVGFWAQKVLGCFRQTQEFDLARVEPGVEPRNYLFSNYEASQHQSHRSNFLLQLIKSGLGPRPETRPVLKVVLNGLYSLGWTNCII